MKKYIKLLLFSISSLICIEILNLLRFIVGDIIAGTSLIFFGDIFCLIAVHTLLGGMFSYERLIQ